MKYKGLIICSLILVAMGCSSPALHETEDRDGKVQLPRVLFITSGISNENAQLAPGIVVAIQSFNKMGIPVRLEPRDILFNYAELSRYNVIILSTFPGYHDADRQYSLSYMSDVELENLAGFVKNGGFLVSGDNVGRNYNDGTDRISVFQQLNTDNWPLAGCFGVTLSEKNMTGYDLAGDIPGYFRYDISRNSVTGNGNELWVLTPDSFLSDSCKILGNWALGLDSTAAVTENSSGEGKALLLASSGLLHPKNDGGLWSEDQIDRFYQYVISRYEAANAIPVRLNPWPAGHEYAFCVSLNAEGNMDQYNRVFSLLKGEKIEPVLFVNGSIGPDIKSLLVNAKYALASSGYGYINHADLKYPEALEDILMNENTWGTAFHGFRFPYTHPGYWSLLALDEKSYQYESSIGADNLDFFHGSIVPYNLVITNDGFYRSTGILEIAPTYHDDYYFLNALKDSENPDSNLLKKDIAVYSKYLENYWNYAVKPYNGLMVFLGHPEFAGYSDSTLSSLKKLIQTVKNDNTWITTMDEVAAFRGSLYDLQLFYNEDKNGFTIEVELPGDKVIEGLCLNCSREVRSASATKGSVKIISKENGSQLLFDASNGQKLSIQFN